MKLRSVQEEAEYLQRRMDINYPYPFNRLSLFYSANLSTTSEHGEKTNYWLAAFIEKTWKGGEIGDCMRVDAKDHMYI
ncbi:hypothetical protein ACTXT7_000457 [Hymenolepis weldensis]